MQLSSATHDMSWVPYQRVHLFSHTQQHAPFPTGLFDAQYISDSEDAAHFLGLRLPASTRI